MKINLTTLMILSLLLCACGKNADSSAASSGSEGGPRGTPGGVLLTTDLPPELNEGTPRAVVLPLFTPMSK